MHITRDLRTIVVKFMHIASHLCNISVKIMNITRFLTKIFVKFMHIAIYLCKIVIKFIKFCENFNKNLKSSIFASKIATFFANFLNFFIKI